MGVSKRLLSLDVFRGITIAGMILVNNPGTWGAIYPPLRHAKWHGLTPTDLIFPFFLFIVGVAITLSLSKRKERGDDQKKLITQILRRGATLFLLGLILNGFPYFDFSSIRIPGVLQRIGIVYIIASVMFLRLNIKQIVYTAVGILVAYWGIMTLIPVPGVGAPNLEPVTNFAAYVDNLLLKGHMWTSTKVWDPEGFLSTLPAIGNALFGIVTGWWLRKKDVDDNKKALYMFVAANSLLLVGYLWDGVFPMNKNIWTSSYTVFTSGLALTFLTMCYFIIDIKGYSKWAKPFEVYGLNAIAVFFASGIVGRIMYMIEIGPAGSETNLKNYLFQNLYLSWLEPMNASLMFALTYIFIWLGLMWILYAKKIFIKV